MSKKALLVGQDIYFKDEKLPMKIRAISERYAVVSRNLHRREDADLLHQKVKMGAYCTFTEAFNGLKDCPTYSIIDFEENIKGADNLIFSDFDYFNETDSRKAIERLENGEMEISHRNRAKLNIDWVRTK